MEKISKICVVGGFNCGKRTLIASIFNCLGNGPLKIQPVRNSDIGNLDNNFLYNKMLELQCQLKQNSSDTPFIMESHDRFPVNHFFIDLKIQKNGCNLKLYISYILAIYLEEQNVTEEIYNAMSDSDVVLIAIDTPYIMGPCEDVSKLLCTDKVCNAVNKVDEIQNILMHIKYNDVNDARMVMFVPVKCEKWAAEQGGLEKVKSRVKEVYGTSIRSLVMHDNIKVSILPVQTIGNILFSEFMKAYLYHSDYRFLRCSKVNDDIIRIDNGDYMKIEAPEKLVENPEYIRVNKPYAWYVVSKNDNTFKPVNVDILCADMLTFILKKQIVVYNKGVRRIMNIFSSEKCRQIEKTICELHDYEGIVRQVEGFEIIKDI